MDDAMGVTMGDNIGDELGDKLPSPCIDVCKFKRAGHCIGCSMTKPQKKSFKKLGGKKAQRRFIAALCEQQRELGKYGHWPVAYRRKCAKKKVDCPIE